MNFLDRLRDMSKAATVHSANTTEHEAVVDLVVAAAYADGRITERELAALEKLDLDHTHWDDGGFSVVQYLPVAISKARAVGDSTVDEFLADVSRRISTEPLRVEALRYCMAEVAGGGVSADESAFIARARRALS